MKYPVLNMKKSFFELLCIAVISFLVIATLLYYKKFEMLPSTIFSSVAAYFAFHAYRFSREKFRLELFEKRWEIYEETLNFCSTVMKYGGLPPAGQDEEKNEEIIQALISAHASFRGLGFHRSKALFGKDVHDAFARMNEDYATIFALGKHIKNPDYVERVDKAIERTWELINQLPKLFEPYMYFGDYKND